MEAADEIVAKQGPLPTLPTETISHIFSYVARFDDHVGATKKPIIRELLESPEVNDHWKRVILGNIPVLLSSSSTPTTMYGCSRFNFDPFMPELEFGAKPCIVDMHNPSCEFLHCATHVAIVLYNLPRQGHQLVGNELGPACRQLFLHPKGKRPVAVAREAIESIGKAFLNLRVLDVHITNVPYSTSAKEMDIFFLTDVPWTPIENGAIPATSMIHTARIPLTFLPALLPAFSNLRHLSLAISESLKGDFITHLRTFPDGLQVLVLEDNHSNWTGNSGTLSSSFNEAVELMNLKELKLRKFNESVSLKLMSILLCPSLQSFSLLFDDMYYFEKRLDVVEPGHELTLDNLPKRVSTKYPNLKSLDISTFREVRSVNVLQAI